MGECAEALRSQQNAALMSTRVMGIKHPNTIQENMHLALHCFISRQLSLVLSLLYGARYLTLQVLPHVHCFVHFVKQTPEVELLDNIGWVLHRVMVYDLSSCFLDSALTVSTTYHGPESLKVALGHHLVTWVCESKAEFWLALQHEKEGRTPSIRPT
ncbi:hypothetical protein P7K49_028212 [Saguinus oedipus]|uniref:Uncharacterized protein n=1 Tax=Saguinus oedipus TaxID=9490 RepID=A0ABQ9UBM2_SAGOE|nr:hypothetical protein P7K49_028212 [Saguinus oedipus]